MAPRFRSRSRSRGPGSPLGIQSLRQGYEHGDNTVEQLLFSATPASVRILGFDLELAADSWHVLPEHGPYAAGDRLRSVDGVDLEGSPEELATIAAKLGDLSVAHQIVLERDGEALRVEVGPASS